ncbi:MAG TPA: endonuclease Q family protein [Candidatus Bilamarchaeaceae archaeon]|nr:endonuclease Q family protein [Candidatus Bilamarchaeaceae archaeon]
MRIVADLHAHSPYARATSPKCTVPGLAHGAKTKGIHVLATGDFTHPQWFQQLKNHLDREQKGLYPHQNIHFILSVEVSCIYEKNGTKKMHHIVLAPDFDIAAQINDRLKKYGDLTADGRPMLGMGSAALVEELMQISKDIVIIPSHAWTPWFSIFGSRSGVDSVEEAFEDQAKHIFALETGLSSDPDMNWMVSSLDKYTLVSNSDAHSLPNLGREANVFDLEELSYRALVNAIRTRKGFVKTYEFYPEEGKYHYDGHRNCNVILHPSESKKYGNRCPVCKRSLTIGVLHRVTDLADRKYGFKPENAVPFQRIVPLPTIIAGAIGKQTGTQAIAEEYDRLIRYFGNEFSVFESSEEKIQLATSPEIARAIIQVQKGEVKWRPGYDGVFGQLILNPAKHEKTIADKKQKTLEEF